MEAELTHFRNAEFLPLKTRVAEMESLNTYSGVTRATHAGYPKKEFLPYENFLGSRSTLRGDAERAALVSGIQFTTSSRALSKELKPDDGSSSDNSTQLRGIRVKGKSVPGLEEIVPSRSDYR
jgi:hypothetical protein